MEEVLEVVDCVVVVPREHKRVFTVIVKAGIRGSRESAQVTLPILKLFLA
jgi:hypothetical protein